MTTRSTTVELVLKAREEGFKTFKELEALTQGIAKRQADMAKSFGNSAAAAKALAEDLKGVGTAEKSIDRLAKKIDTLAKTKSGIDELGTAAAGLKARIAELQAAVAENNRNTVDPKLEQQYQALTGRVGEMAQAITRAKAALAEFQTEAKDDALAKNRGSLEAAIANQQRLTGAYDTQQTKLRELVAAERERLANATTKTASNVDQLTAKYQAQLLKVQQLADARGKDGEQTATQAKRYATAQGQLEKLSQSLDKAKVASATATAAQEAFSNSTISSDKVRKAAEQLRLLAQESRKAGDDVKRAAANLKTVEISPQASEKIRKLIGNIADLESEYTALAKRAKDTGAALVNSVGPVPKGLQQELSGLQKQLAGTEQKILKQSSALNHLETELKEAGVDTADLAAAQQRLAGSAGTLAKAQQELAGKAREAGNAQGFFGDHSRKAMDFTQRLRGQVISLVSAYVGLYGAANEVANIFGTASKLEGTEAKFKVAFEGDATKAADEMKFVRAEAERLKLNFVELGDAYARFTTALSPGALSVDQQRKVFTGFAVAARVARISTADLVGTFKALEQIASKGLAMEELSGQLGDRVAGSVRLFAEALGYGADQLDEFYKAVQAKAFSNPDVLVKAAVLMEQKYGIDLPAALESASGSLGQFENAVNNLRLIVADSGFLDSLTTGLNNMSAAMKDPEVQQTLVGIAGAVGDLLEITSMLLPVMDELVYLAGAIVASKLAVWFYKGGKEIFVFGTKAFKAATDINGLLEKLLLATPRLAEFAAKLAPAIASLGLLAKALAPIAIFAASAAAVGSLINAMGEADDAATANAEALKELVAQAQSLGEMDIKDPLKDFSADDLKKHIKEVSAAISVYEKMLLRMQVENESAIESLVRGASDLNPMFAFLRLPADLGLFDNYDEDTLQKVEMMLGVLRKRMGEVSAEVRSRPAFVEEGERESLAATEESIASLAEALRDLADTRADQAFDSLAAAYQRAEDAFNDGTGAADAFLAQARDRSATTIAIQQDQLNATIAILNQETAAKVAALEEQKLEETAAAEAMRQILVDTGAARIEATKSALDRVADELRRAEDAERNHASQVISLQDRIADARLNAATDLADVSGSKSPFAAYAAYLAQVQELERLAAETTKALQEGNFKRAEELAQKRIELAKQVANSEVKGTTGDIVSNERARAVATDNVRKANEQLQKALEGQAKTQEEAGQAAATGAKAAREELDKLQITLDAIQQQQIDLSFNVDAEKVRSLIATIKIEAEANPSVHKIVPESREIDAKIKQISKPTQSTHTIKLVLDDSGIPRYAFKDGGPAAQGFASGGKIQGPGTPTSDSIPAYLSRDEWVINARASRFWGDDVMRRINSMKPLKLSTGGPVRGISSPVFAGGGSGEGKTVTHYVNVNGNAIGPIQGSESVVNQLINELAGLR